MKYLVLIIAIGAFSFNSTAQTKKKTSGSKIQPTQKTAPKKKDKKGTVAKPTSSEIRKRPGKPKVTAKKKD